MNHKNILISLTDSQLTEIIGLYDIGSSVVAIERIKGGLANTNYKLMTDKGSFLLKICEDKSFEELKIQCRALEHLKKNGFFTAFPHPLKVPDGDNEYVLRLSGGNTEILIIIYDFLNGTSARFDEVSSEMMKDLGRELGKLHSIPALPYLPPLMMGVAVIDPFLKEMEQSDKFKDHPFIRFLTDELNRIRPTLAIAGFPEGILHGDLFPDNCLWQTDNRKLIAIIDWEEICIGQLMIDVGMTIVGCCYPVHNTLDMGLLDAFMKEYSTIRTLSEEEKKTLYDFIDYAILGVAFWRFRQFNVRNYDAALCNKHEEMVQRLKSNPWNQSRFSQ